MIRLGKCHLWLALLVALCAREAEADEVLSFDDISAVHGTIVDGDYAGVVISARNASGNGPNLAVVFNSQFGGSTTDTDLLGPTWKGGNLAPDTVLGNLLIIQEAGSSQTGDVIDFPDDEGARPAGYLEFKFDDPIASFGFDLVDVEGTKSGEEPGRVEFYSGDFLVESVLFSELLDETLFGDNSANRIDPINVINAQFPVDLVRIQLGGSAGVDNIRYTPLDDPGPIVGIPEPATVWMWVMLVVASLVVLIQRKHVIA